MLKLNGVAVVSPKSFKVDTLDIDGEGSARNARGDMFRDRIAIKRKIYLAWGPLTQIEISSILRAVGDVFFPVEYLDPQLGQITKIMYVSDRSSPALYDGVWEGLSFNLIEQ